LTAGLCLLLIGLRSPLPPDDFEATREAFLDQVNAVRAAAKAKPLKLLPVLNDVAQGRADALAAGREAPGVPAEEAARRSKAQGYESRLLSEVIAQADGDVASVVEGWIGGEPSVELTGAEFRDMGLGVSLRGEVPLYVLLLGLSWEDYFKRQTDALKNLEAMREDMLVRVNRERTSRGLAPLRRQPALDAAAQGHADDMFRKRYYSHDSQDGRTTLDRVQAKGYRAKYAGENIARGQYSVEEVMTGWMESPTHRDHILSPLFNDVGFGLAFGKNPGGYEILWVQNFGRPKGRERL